MSSKKSGTDLGAVAAAAETATPARGAALCPSDLFTPPTAIKVTLLYRDIPSHCALSAAHKRELRQFARAICANSKVAVAFNCLLTDDAELLRLNSLFLGHAYPTDVLSFPSGSQSGNLGEMAISVQRAADQAKDYGHTLLDELRILMLHGFLHLSGLDHENDGGEMARVERKWRDVLGLPPTLIARSMVK
ncbi:MAG TPA: rRNA maturation RNase YbeY [Bryobacteraceae bacterium]|jgi:probable rRNA maturation factor|nr:rRNA maturation RNase YbeY [Bryobacteraceae bacterium]